jgi:hypothetical protein
MSTRLSRWTLWAATRTHRALSWLLELIRQSRQMGFRKALQAMMEHAITIAMASLLTPPRLCAPRRARGVLLRLNEKLTGLLHP